MYLIYGIHWMLTVVTGPERIPQAALVRGLREVSDPYADPMATMVREDGNADGPGKLTRLLGMDRAFYGEDLVSSSRIWLEDRGITPEYTTGPRVGIDYAGTPWKEMPWRYCMNA